MNMTRACLFDDVFVFDADGTFQSIPGDQTWVEPNFGNNPEGCAETIAPWNGAAKGSWVHDEEQNTITISGAGSYLGLFKIGESVQLETGSTADETITYTNVSFSDDGNTMTVLKVIADGSTFWRFIFAKEGSTGAEIPQTDTDGDGFGDPNNTVLSCNPSSLHIEDSSDCDDSDPTQNPNGIEICNEEDDNCDEEVDNQSIDAITWFLDIDGDGFGSIFVTQDSCDQPPAPPGYTFVLDQSDCDDTRDSIYPGAIEYCNGFDDDCDGSIDANAVDALTWYADFDNDDFGNPSDIEIQCEAPTGYIDIAEDCDDNNQNIYPNADEICNSKDDDCNGFIDDQTIDALPFYPDTDSDGFGDPNLPLYQCVVPPNYVENNSDCDDGDSSIFPLAQEFCDGVDQDCDGNNFYELDLDSNGYLACQESMWMRNSSSSATGPFGSFSQAASYLTNQNITIADLYHGNTPITPELLENVGLYVHHGNNMNGALGAYTNAEASALEQWVFNGGRMLFMGYHSTEDACESSNSIPS